MERRSFLGVAIPAVLAVDALAQDGTLASSVTSTKVVVSSFTVLSPPLGSASANIGISIQTAAGVETGSLNVSIPNALAPTLTVASLISAMMTTRSGETGSNARKMSFRVLGECFDKGALPQLSAVNP